jgi:hypothetical protein
MEPWMMGWLLGWAAAGVAAWVFARQRAEIARKYSEENMDDDDPALAEALAELEEVEPDGDSPDSGSRADHRS